VADKHAISDGKREFSAHFFENPHAASSLIGYVADVRLAFVNDLWNPGPKPPSKIDSPLAAVVTAVKQAGISPTRFAGGHGGVGDYAPLAALAGN